MADNRVRNLFIDGNSQLQAFVLSGSLNGCEYGVHCLPYIEWLQIFFTVPLNDL